MHIEARFVTFNAVYLYKRTRGAGMYREWERRGMHKGYWWERHKGRDHYEDQDIGGWIIIKWTLER
jgi:hypothetical protein